MATLLAAALWGLAQTTAFGHTGLRLLFAVLFVISAGLLIGAGYCIIRSLIGYTQERLPYPADLRSHADELATWHKDNGLSESAARIAFMEYLGERYLEAADKYARNNIARSGYVYRANVALALGLAIAVPAAITSTILVMQGRDRPYNIRIVEPIHLDTLLGGRNEQGQRQAAPEAATAVTPKTSTEATRPEERPVQGRPDTAQAE